MGSTRRLCIATAIVLSGILPARLSSAAPVGIELTAHIRTDNERIVEVMSWTMARSAHFRQLAAAIELADSVVYLTEGRCHDGLLGSCVTLLATPGIRRILVRIDSRMSRPSVAAALAHELQHAVEIASHPEVRDDSSLRNLYGRIGYLSCDSQPECWETIAAQDAERRVWQECDARPDPHPDLNKQWFGVWTLDLERSDFGGAPPPREAVRMIRPCGFGLISSVTRQVTLDGTTTEETFVLRRDGRRYRVSSTTGDSTISETPVDRDSVRFVLERGGETLATGTTTLRSDNEMVVEAHLLDAYGQEMTVVTVWRKKSGSD